jgi:hypothetical protein
MNSTSIDTFYFPRTPSRRSRRVSINIFIVLQANCFPKWNGGLWEFNNQEAGSTTNLTAQSHTFFFSGGPRVLTLIQAYHHQDLMLLIDYFKYLIPSH